MGPAEMVVALAGIGCGTGIVSMLLRTFSGGRRRAAELELAAARARLTQLELDNEQLRRQVEWHSRLLEAQDRVVSRLAPAGQDGVASGR
jgi:hypothetical protein